MAEIGKLDQLGAGNGLRGRLAQHRIITELGTQIRRREILGDGGVVFLTDHEQGRHRDVTKAIQHRLREDHVVDQRGIPGDDLLAVAVIEAGKHIDPPIVTVFPFTGVICRLLVSLDAGRGDLLFARIPLIDRDWRDSLGRPILQSDWIDHNEMADFLWIEQRIIRRQHAAGRMADDNRLLHAELGQQRMGVAGELLEGELIGGGLARFAETNLVRCNHAIAGGDQILDGRLPGRRTEILAVEQHHRLAVWLVGFDVHISHLQRLPLRVEAEMLDVVGIIETFELCPVTWRLFL